MHFVGSKSLYVSLCPLPGSVDYLANVQEYKRKKVGRRGLGWGRGGKQILNMSLKRGHSVDISISAVRTKIVMKSKTVEKENYLQKKSVFGVPLCFHD